MLIKSYNLLQNFVEIDNLGMRTKSSQGLDFSKVIYLVKT